MATVATVDPTGLQSKCDTRNYSAHADNASSIQISALVEIYKQ